MTVRYTVKAYYPPSRQGGKPRYRPIGMLEWRGPNETPRLKLDVIPVGPGWNGWCNCYPDEPPAASPGPLPPSDDIPF